MPTAPDGAAVLTASDVALRAVPMAAPRVAAERGPDRWHALPQAASRRPAPPILKPRPERNVALAAGVGCLARSRTQSLGACTPAVRGDARRLSGSAAGRADPPGGRIG